MNYNTGSSAYKYDYYSTNDSSAYELEYIRTHEKIEEHRNARAVKKQKQAKIIAKFVSLSIVAILVFSVALLYTRVMVIRTANRVSDLKNELATISSENNKKSMELEQSIDLKKIEEIAISQYNMQRPDKSQTVYVNVAQRDYAEVVKPEGVPVFGALGGVIKKALAYLN